MQWKAAAASSELQFHSRARASVSQWEKRLRHCLQLALTKERNQKSKELKSAIKVAAAAADRCAAFGLCLSTVLKGLYQTRDDYFI